MGRATTTVGLTLAATLFATAAARAAEPEAAQLSLEEIAVRLSSADTHGIGAAIEAAAGLGSRDAAVMIGQRVRAGLPPRLLDAAIDTLMLLGEPSTAPVFVALAVHRRHSVRLRALQVLIALRPKDTERLLLRGLGDSNAAVRGAAAEGLGEIGAKSSVDTLFRAFDRGNAQAAAAIGRLCPAGDLPRVLAYVGRIPLTSLTPRFDALLARRDLGEAPKLQVVMQLHELGTAEARGTIEGLRARLPPDAPARLRRAIEDAVVRVAP